MSISILGAGAWGTALAVSLAPHHRVTLWSRDEEQIHAMQKTRRNQFYLPDIKLPDELQLSDSFAQAMAEPNLVIIATPMSALRQVLQEMMQASLHQVSVLWLCKGIEKDTGLLAHQLAHHILPSGYCYGALSGPSFAQEVAQGLPAAVTLASANQSFAEQTADWLRHERLRIYSSQDLIGVEIGGAVKNVMAIASGICDGLKLGNNARAALITRGLAEVSRLGEKMGGHPETLSGLSGAGDLILTCTGDLSRNRKVGMSLAQGQSLSTILKQLGHVAEGVYTAEEVYRLARHYQVSMPICEAVYQVLYQNLPAMEAVEALLSREPSAEF